jgi:hypothetical protein
MSMSGMTLLGLLETEEQRPRYLKFEFEFKMGIESERTLVVESMSMTGMTASRASWKWKNSSRAI